MKVIIATQETWKIEVVDEDLRLQSYKTHLERCGLEVTMEGYVSGLVLQIISNGFQANDPNITGMVIRLEKSKQRIKHKI